MSQEYNEEYNEENIPIVDIISEYFDGIKSYSNFDKNYFYKKYFYEMLICVIKYILNNRVPLEREHDEIDNMIIEYNKCIDRIITYDCEQKKKDIRIKDYGYVISEYIGFKNNLSLFDQNKLREVLVKINVELVSYLKSLRVF